MRILDDIIDWRRRRRIEKLSDSASEAIEQVARHQANVAYANIMAGYYRDQADAVDPATDWWAFAHFMQKWHDHETDAMFFVQKTSEARSLHAARIAKIQAAAA